MKEARRVCCTILGNSYDVRWGLAEDSSFKITGSQFLKLATNRDRVRLLTKGMRCIF